jgi:hypothetical protein
VSPYRFSRPSYGWGPQGTAVVCPECGEGELELRFSCLSTRFTCSSCDEAFQLADLVDRVEEDQFETLASFVGDRLSDRVG